MTADDRTGPIFAGSCGADVVQRRREHSRRDRKASEFRARGVRSDSRGRCTLLVIEELERELTAKPRPAERRRIRQSIKAIRRNPFKPVTWAEKHKAMREQTD